MFPDKYFFSLNKAVAKSTLMLWGKIGFIIVELFSTDVMFQNRLNTVEI